MARTILVVEDTELLRRIYTDKLTQDGYDVHQAADGQEALNALRSQVFDLVLLDLIMPRMSGLETLEAMQNDPRTRDIPVLVLSNLGQEADVERGLALGAVGYLVKNAAKPADVSEKIATILDDLAERGVEPHGYRIFVRDHEGDADSLVRDSGLQRRLWCGACEVELALELLPKPDDDGWYDAHLLCPSCGKQH